MVSYRRRKRYHPGFFDRARSRTPHSRYSRPARSSHSRAPTSRAVYPYKDPRKFRSINTSKDLPFKKLTYRSPAKSYRMFHSIYQYQNAYQSKAKTSGTYLRGSSKSQWLGPNQMSWAPYKMTKRMMNDVMLYGYNPYVYASKLNFSNTFHDEL